MTKKIVIAPDSFKGSMTAKEASDAIESGAKIVFPDAEFIKVPMADGGEGTVQSIVDSENGKICERFVLGPTCREVKARYGIIGDNTAIIEMAEASGLILLKDCERDPLMTTTYGTGQLILDALDKNCRKFIIGIGGSSTNDGGAGLAQALGAKLVNSKGLDIPFGGGGLGLLESIDVSKMDPRLKECTFIVACDVDNPLCGPNGASAIFGPQKGATPEMIEILDKNLNEYAEIIKRDIGKDVAEIPGSGAAGGLGGGLIAFCNAETKNGIDIVIDATRLREKILSADLVITGEGKCDYQTLSGKTVMGVSKTAKEFDIPIVVLAGAVGDGIEGLYDHGIIEIAAISDASMTLEYAMTNAVSLLEKKSEEILSSIKNSGRL